MKTKKNMVKMMLMSTLTAGMLTIGFTACSDELDAEMVPQAPQTEMTVKTRADASKYNINEHSVQYGRNKKVAEPFDTKNWERESAIFCYVGEGGDPDIYDAESGEKISGYKLVNLPWSDDAVSNNIPKSLWRELNPNPDNPDEDNPWKLVLMNCGADNVEDGNFLGFYNELTGVMRVLVYVPKNVQTNGNTSAWGIQLCDRLASRSIFRYGVPSNRSITDAKGKEALGQSDDMSQIVSPWQKGLFSGFDGNPLMAGWWAFDIDLSMYRSEEASFTKDSYTDERTDILSVTPLSKLSENMTINSDLVAKMTGSLDLETSQANTESGIFAPIEGMLGKANDVVGLYKVAKGILNPNPLEAIESGIKLAKGACKLAGIDYGEKKTGFNGYKGSMNINMDGKINSKGAIESTQSVSGIQPVSFKSRNFLTQNCATFGQGVWNLKQAPVVYVTDGYLDWRSEEMSTRKTWHDMMISYDMEGVWTEHMRYVGKNSPFASAKHGDVKHGRVCYFDPSSIQLELNGNIFTEDEIKNAKVYAICGVRPSADFGSTEAYRNAQSLHSSKFSDFKQKNGPEYVNRPLTEAAFDALSNQKDKLGMTQGFTSKTSDCNGGKHGAFGLGNDSFIMEAQGLSNNLDNGVLPPYEVTVTVIVKHGDKDLVYTRTYLPEFKEMKLADMKYVSGWDKELMKDCPDNYVPEVYLQQRKHIRDLYNWTRRTLVPFRGSAYKVHDWFVKGYKGVSWKEKATPTDNKNLSFPNLIDGDLSTKWMSSMKVMKMEGARQIKTAQGNVWVCEFMTNFPVNPSSYVLVTSNDNRSNHAWRPRTWTLLGAKDIFASFVELDKQQTSGNGKPRINALSHDNSVESEYFLDPTKTSGGMTHFRLEILNTWDDDEDSYMQLGEFYFKYSGL